MFLACGACTGEQPDQGGSQRVDVRPRVGGVGVPVLLRSGVSRGAHELPGYGHPASRLGPTRQQGEAKVEDLDFS